MPIKRSCKNLIVFIELLIRALLGIGEKTDKCGVFLFLKCKQENIFAEVNSQTIMVGAGDYPPAFFALL